MTRDVVTMAADESAEDAFHAAQQRPVTGVAPAVDADGRLVGILTRQGALRATLYRPERRRRTTGCGSRRRSASTATSSAGPRTWSAAGVDLLVVDTAHGHQEKMLETLHAVRDLDLGIPICAGNVVPPTGSATSSRPVPTSSRSASDRARCARPG